MCFCKIAVPSVRFDQGSVLQLWLRSRCTRWGGVVDLPFLKPTAGREALDAPSNQLLQQMVSALDTLVSPIAAQHSESFTNECFLQWIVATAQFQLCGPLEVTVRPGRDAETLESAVQHGRLRYYSGRDSQQ